MPPIAVSTTSLTSATREPVARRLLAVDLEVDVEAAGRALGERAARARDPADGRSRSRSRPSRSSPRSSPNTSMPSGLRTPVASISVRVWIGIHQTLGMPG